MAAGFWSLCYAAQPSKALARPLAGAVARSRRGAALQQAYNAAMAQATSTVQKLSWLRAVRPLTLGPPGCCGCTPGAQECRREVPDA